jgi:hypothetical protein
LQVIGILGNDAATLAGILCWIWRVDRFFLQDPTNGRLANVNTNAGQRVGDLHLAQRRTEQLYSLDRITNKVGKSIHRCHRLKQRVVIGTSKPTSDCFV